MSSIATDLGLVVGLLVVAYFALRPLVRTYLTYRGTRVITCPETGKPAAVEVDARLALASQASMGTPTVQLASCSRWPERRACGQGCLVQIEAAPHDCLARTILERWYAGKQCAFCRRPFGDIHWSDHKPAARLATGQTIQWAQIRPAELPVVLADSLPVCWNCHIAETFRRQYPGLVVDDPPARPHAT
jgi:hypothetical protein